MRTSAARREDGRLLRPRGPLRMQIVLFHLMPYADLDLAAGRKNGTVWVTLPNRNFDPERGHKLYNRYLDELEYGEELGWDVLAGSLPRGARYNRARVDRARAVHVPRPPLQLPVRESLAAPLPKAASADLDPVAGQQGDDRLGLASGPALYLSADLQSRESG